MARYKVSRGKIIDTVTGRWEGDYTPERLAALNRSGVPEAEGLEALSYKDLRDLATELDITGRSSMNKEELISAILDAQETEEPTEEE